MSIRLSDYCVCLSVRLSVYPHNHYSSELFNNVSKIIIINHLPKVVNGAKVAFVAGSKLMVRFDLTEKPLVGPRA